MLHTGMLKGFMDGSLGSRSAALLQPYADDPANSGLPRYDEAKLTEMTKERVDAGFQIGFPRHRRHKACRWHSTLSPKPRKTRRRGRSKLPTVAMIIRLRIEGYAQVTNPAQIAQFRKLKDYCFHAAQPLAYRHELGRGAFGT